MYIGIDIGTSSVKSVLVDDSQSIIGAASYSLSVSRPHSNWSEQDPEQWWQGVDATMQQLKSDYPSQMAAVKAIGLSGQMHGATLLDSAGNPLRPCILWNDGRSQKQCDELELNCPASRQITGNIAMPGFTAPKILWVRENEPDVMGKVAMVLLPKDYVRFRMTGEYLSDMSDSSGTLWLDCGNRRWSSQMLDACGLDISMMPGLVEGSEPSAILKNDFCSEWGLSLEVVIAGGAGDNAASACGIGAIDDGDAFISLGTSGVIFVAGKAMRPNTEGAVHAFCHAIPDTWHQMAVMLSATSCFDWLSRARGVSESEIYKDLDAEPGALSNLIFLPHLSGERTPYNDASLSGAFVGIDHSTDRRDLSMAVARGLGFAFKDCLDVLQQAGTRVDRLIGVGGGTRSSSLLQILANILGVSIELPDAADRGAAFGAARLAMLAATGADPAEVMRRPSAVAVYEPDNKLDDYFSNGWAHYRALTRAIKEARIQ